MTILTGDEVQKMRAASRVAAGTLEHVSGFVKPGIKTLEIDQICHDFMLSHNATPATLNYRGYPKSSCTSVNSVICHGVPDGTILKDGDIVNVDVTCVLDGYYGDTSRTFLVGDVSDDVKKLTDVAKTAMFKGIEAITPGGTVEDIGFAIDKYTTRNGFYVVKEIGGHGIGRSFHEEPFVPSFGRRHKGAKLVPFHCITVEPMVNMTNAKMVECPIQGSEHKIYKTSDGTPSAQFEHTVLVTDTGYEILTI